MATLHTRGTHIYSTTHYGRGRRHDKCMAVAYRSPSCSIIIICNALYQAGRGRLPTVPCVRFYTERGRRLLYRPLCLVLYRGDGSLLSPVFGFIEQGGGRLSTVTCVRPYIAGGDGSLPSPEFGFVYHRGTDLYRPLCLFLNKIYCGVWGRGRCQIPPPVGRVEVE